MGGKKTLVSFCVGRKKSLLTQALCVGGKKTLVSFCVGGKKSLLTQAFCVGGNFYVDGKKSLVSTACACVNYICALNSLYWAMRTGSGDGTSP